jgi:regulator of sigma E protease
MGNSVIWRIITRTSDTIPIEINRNGQTQTITVSPEKDPEHELTGWSAWFKRGATRKIGIGPANDVLIIKKILPDSPAEAAGLRPGDLITAMNGERIYSPGSIDNFLKDHPKDKITFMVEKGAGANFTSVKDLPHIPSVPVEVQPEAPISPSPLPKDGPQALTGIVEWESIVNNVYPTPWEQVRDSVQAVTGTIGALVTPKSNVGPSLLSGPVGIMNLFFAILSSDNGWKLALWFAVLINVNLALLNLLPLPVLDGGHITLAIIEWLRRRPLSLSLLEPLQTACALLLIGYMAYITFFDVQDTAHMAYNSTAGEIKFATKSATP